MNIFTSIFAINLLGSGLANVIPVQDASPSAEKGPISLGNDTGLLNKPCPTHFISPAYGEYCYYFSTKDEPMLSWIQAQLKCQNIHKHKDATLVRPYIDIIDAFIRGTLMEKAAREGEADYWWMDLTMDDSIDNTFTNWTDVPFRYTDGTTPDYTNWYAAEPYNQEFKHCGIYEPEDYRWANWYCGTTARYICQVKQE